jgi:hypothetical protein
VLTELETRVAEYNVRQRARMVKQSQQNHVVDFLDGSIATLRIPLKLRLRAESERLAVRILACDHGQYKLMSNTVGLAVDIQATSSTKWTIV